VSGAVSSSDVEIDLGRWAHRIISRWYIVVAAVVVAIVIALLGAGGGHKEWTARALVNQGQPYTSTNQPIGQSLGTNPSAAATILKQDVIVKLVAGKVDLRAGQLKGAISTQPIGAVNAKTASTPLVAVIVRGPWKTKVADAANRLAQQLVIYSGRYQQARLASVQGLVNLDKTNLKVLAGRDAQARLNYQTIAASTTLSAIDRSLALTNASGLLNSIETRQAQTQSQFADDSQTLAQVKYIEMSSILTRAVATQTTAASKRAGYAVAILLGLIVGVLLALISYAAWPVKPRDADADAA
jgi:hypothetical protein